MEPEAKRLKIADDPEGKRDPAAAGDCSGPLSQFLEWCEKMELELSAKVCITTEGTVADYGMIARETLAAGETVFIIPRSALLSQHTTSIHSLLEKEEASLESDSGWIPLMLSLFHEYTNGDSRWRPYFSLWPDLGALGHPMFWPEDERVRLLQGTYVPEIVEKDLANMDLEYYTIVLPFMRLHPNIFDPKIHTLELYKKLVALVMAYSFQESTEDEDEQPNAPFMVPVADLLNHVTRNNAQLEFSSMCLRMVTTQGIAKGQELFNTYGQMANWQLLHMYGFVEPYPDNTNDAVDIQMMTLRKAALQGAKTEQEQQLVVEKWDFLCQLELVGEEGAYVIGVQEVLTEQELLLSLKVLCMSSEEFREYKENDGWQEDSEEDKEEMVFSNEAICQLQESWKKLLYSGVILTQQNYISDLAADENLIDNPVEYLKLSRREQQALQVRYGQKKILQQLLELTS
ncbi:N-lysine methyltransferase SETD6 isoform X2 [Rhinatrema bivittatum]|uniref:N-lysine methyltransferase SETD6 isoform X2 n=1 Tax=Rhinatrema bivittatum TaxID=194408 RepID=UPI0011296E2F|nr:N-lysine methyltransferase SETD6 isoform X2 [Rhinatrema bivittatum]